MFNGCVNYNPFTKKYDVHIECMNIEVEVKNGLTYKEMKAYTESQVRVNWYYPYKDDTAN
ncbi:hypothetical protein vBBceHLY2_00129 [Bacillus phage vB_BceH_LY2]|nr:hypothetical protein vBBceHLY2_00129 [Bacillus phage vB_BceH_LY2]